MKLKSRQIRFQQYHSHAVAQISKNKWREQSSMAKTAWGLFTT